MVTATRSATRSPGPAAGPRPHPHRLVFSVAAGVISAAGLAGAAQLVTGTYTPPVADLDPLGLRSWVLPGLWLFASVGVPWATATWAAVRRWPSTPTVVLGAAGLLAFELAVQIPFLGFSPFQPILGAAAVVLGLLAWRDRRAWPAPARPGPDRPPRPY